MGRSPEARPDDRDEDEDEEAEDEPEASPRGRGASAEPAGHPYRMPGVLPRERVPKAPKSRTAITLAWATLGGLAVLAVVRAVASVPVQKPAEPKATTLVAQAPVPITAPEVVISPPAPAAMVAARAEEVAIAMALERKDYATVKSLLLPKVATLECDEVRVLRDACSNSQDWKCMQTTYKASRACSVSRKPR
jgi:hypothetical protein